jgi:hypothetical protein
MPTSYTNSLGLALPATGELSGTWGSTVNDYITQYLDSAIAGAQTLTTDADVTLTKTTGTALGATSSQYAILNCTGSRAAARNITVPAASKTYVVINATTGGFAVTLRGAGPTTGVSIANGERAVCAWNGSDFVKVASTGGDVTANNLTVNGNTTLGNTAVAGTLGVTGAATFSAGTANGVTYLNASKVLTSGSALTFDGTDFATTGNVTINNAKYYYGKNAAGSAVRLLGVNAGNVNYVGAIDSGPTEVNYGAATTITAQYWNIGGSEQMRLDSSGNLGIGTTNPTRKLQVSSVGTNYIASVNTGANPSCLLLGADPGGTALYSWTTVGGSTGVPLSFFTGASESMRLDTSGNLGLGVTPSAWAGFSVFQNSRGSVAGNTGELDFSHNAYFDGAWKYIANGFATNHYQTNGTYVWRTAPSGTAGNAISFTQAMTLDASGNLAIQDGKQYFWGSGRTAVQGSSASDTMQFFTASIERARITSGGDLLVGTTANPGVFNRSVVIDSGANTLAGVVFQNDTTGRGSTDGSHIGISSSDFVIVNLENAPIRLRTNNVERMVVKGPGQVRFVPLASAPGGAEAGDVYYDSGTNKLRCYNGTTWNDLF